MYLFGTKFRIRNNILHLIVSNQEYVHITHIIFTSTPILNLLSTHILDEIEELLHLVQRDLSDKPSNNYNLNNKNKLNKKLFTIIIKYPI